MTKVQLGTSLVVQWLKLCISTAGVIGLLPSWGTQIPHATPSGQKISKEINLFLKGATDLCTQHALFHKCGLRPCSCICSLSLLTSPAQSIEDTMLVKPCPRLHCIGRTLPHGSQSGVRPRSSYTT